MHIGAASFPRSYRPALASFIRHPPAVGESAAAQTRSSWKADFHELSHSYAALRVEIVRFDQKVLVIFLSLCIEGISSIPLAQTLLCLVFQVASIV